MQLQKEKKSRELWHRKSRYWGRTTKEMLLKRAERGPKDKMKELWVRVRPSVSTHPFFPFHSSAIMNGLLTFSKMKCIWACVGVCRCVATSRVVFMLAGVMPRTIRILDHTSKTSHWHTHQHAVVCSLTETWQRRTHLHRHRKSGEKVQTAGDASAKNVSTLLCCRLQRFFREIQQLYFKSNDF